MDDERRRATEFLQELYAAGEIDAERLESGLSGVLAAESDSDMAVVLAELPAPVPITRDERRMTRPLEVQGMARWIRLTGRWQVAAETHVSAQLGSVLVDLTEAEFDARVVDLHVYTGWGRITVVVPRGVAVDVVSHHGPVVSRLDPPVPGFPVIRLDATTNIGRIVLRHPKTKRAGRSDARAHRRHRGR